jgi:DNA polymerase-1
MLGREEVTKADRQLAKAVNFGFLYGMGARGFQAYARTNYSIALSEEEASGYRAGFFRSYAGLQGWHARTQLAIRAATGETELRTLAGRRFRMGANDHLPMWLNLPVQGTGADGLKLALALLWERRAQCPGAIPVLACHDEIVVEAPATEGGTAAAWLKAAMLDAMGPLLAPVPAEVEVQIGSTWAG